MCLRVSIRPSNLLRLDCFNSSLDWGLNKQNIRRLILWNSIFYWVNLWTKGLREVLNAQIVFFIPLMTVLFFATWLPLLLCFLVHSRTTHTGVRLVTLMSLTLICFGSSFRRSCTTSLIFTFILNILNVGRHWTHLHKTSCSFSYIRSFRCNVFRRICPFRLH